MRICYQKRSSANQQPNHAIPNVLLDSLTRSLANLTVGCDWPIT